MWATLIGPKGDTLAKFMVKALPSKGDSFYFWQAGLFYMGMVDHIDWFYESNKVYIKILLSYTMRAN
jgi:hypothetical protein